MKYVKHLAYIVGIFLLVGVLYFIYPVFSHASGYSYYRTVTIQGATKVPSTQSSFTVLVCANMTTGNGNSCPTVTGLNQSGAGANVQNSNGFDIVFSSSDSTCQTGLMNWEMENYVPSTGEMEAWVLFPSLPNSNTQIYMCYGNSGISAFQGGSSGSAWHSFYKFVGHQLNATAPQDSTISACNGVVTTVPAATGQIDGAGDFTASTAKDQLGGTTCGSTGSGSNGKLDFISFTYYAWINPNQSATEDIYTGAASTMPQFRRDSNNKLSLNKYNVGSLVISSGTVPNNVWSQVALTYDAAGNYAFYINGVKDSFGTSSTPFTLSNFSFVNHTWTFGLGNGQPHMLMDEGEISTSTRSTDWIATEYNNQNNPSTFETFGSETPITGGSSGPTGPVHMFTFTGQKKVLFTGQNKIIFQ